MRIYSIKIYRKDAETQGIVSLRLCTSAAKKYYICIGKNKKMKKNFVEELKWRGMLQDIMPGTEELLNKEMVTGYIGFDPTSDSLGVGLQLPCRWRPDPPSAGCRSYRADLQPDRG